MVDHNKDLVVLEPKLDRCQVQITTLEEETYLGTKEPGDTQSELAKAREELCMRENAVLTNNRYNKKQFHQQRL
jgi:hypothetical protein